MSFFNKIDYYGHALWNMHIRRSAKLPYLPEYVALEVTNACNFKCAFCPQSDPDHHNKVPKTYLDEEDCNLYLQKIRAAGIKTNLMHWTLDGEPFMHKGFAKLVWISSNYGFTNTYFASNGYLCTIERLLEFPRDRVCLNIAIDFCADKDYFEEVRGTKGSWDRVQANIKEILSDTRIGNVRVDITDISSFQCNDAGKLNVAFQALKRLFGEHARLGYRTRTFHNATGYLELAKKSTGNYHLCPYPWTHFRVASNGDVVPCCRDLQHMTVLGNLKTQSVEEIWNGEPMLELREFLLRKKPQKVSACEKCDLPYDDSKFTLKNIFHAARGRLQLFSK